MKELESKYIAELKKIILDFFRNKRVKVFLFGSRAREEEYPASDVDIGIIPLSDSEIGQITLLKERIENSNIPYKVDIVNLNEVSDDFKKEILKEAIVWKDCC
jgi:predicted nucleotidyltransferase